MSEEATKKENTSSRVSTLQDEEQVQHAQQKPSLTKWNKPRANMFRFFATLLSFIIMGMNDGCVGALIPYITDYYDISYTAISCVFLAGFVGYALAALSNNLVHHHWGQRGVAIVGPIGRFIGYLVLCFHPPFPVLPLIMLFPGFGNGIEDGAWNAWIGNMENANELLGFLHGAYGLGGTIGPLISTAMVTKGGLQWYTFYYLMAAVAGTEVFATTTAFWGATGAHYRETHRHSTSGERTTTRQVMKEPIVWLTAIFLLGYVGAEVSLGGWIVEFMLVVRDAEPFPAGVTVTGFWLGLTVGRVVLGFVTGRIGEKLAITIYLILSIGLQLIYWLIPNFVVSAICVAFLGFFIGPLFPAAIVVATKLLPSSYHVSAIGFAAALGGGGAAVFPFAVGAIAQSKGVWVLQPIVLATFVYILVVWWCLPGGLRRGGLERARENSEKAGHQFKLIWNRIKG